jgi:hypothetical protein
MKPSLRLCWHLKRGFNPLLLTRSRVLSSSEIESGTLRSYPSTPPRHEDVMVSRMGQPAASVSRPDHGSRLDVSIPKGGVSLSAHHPPREMNQSLPLTLSIEIETTVTAYSKATKDCVVRQNLKLSLNLTFSTSNTSLRNRVRGQLCGTRNYD